MVAEKIQIVAALHLPSPECGCRVCVAWERAKDEDEGGPVS